jgi:hypothetical protein
MLTKHWIVVYRRREARGDGVLHAPQATRKAQAHAQARAKHTRVLADPWRALSPVPLNPPCPPFSPGPSLVFKVQAFPQFL